MKIFITGGSGFAGSGLVKRMLKAGHTVTVLDIVSPHMSWNLMDVIDNPNLTYKWKAIQDIEPADLEGQDIVAHFAAQADAPMAFTSPRYTVSQNVNETIALLETCRKVQGIKKILYAGSGNEYGRAVYLPIDENHPLTPHNPYGFSKAAGEMACWTYRRCYNLPITIMSNGACLGAGMRRDIFVYLWLRNMILGLPVRLEGGDQTRDLTYVSDILDALELTINADNKVTDGQKFQISYGEEYSVEEILAMCIKVTGINPKVERKPHRPGEKGQREFFSNAKARYLLKYNPKVTPMQGIDLTYKWMLSLPEFQGKIENRKD